MNRYRKVLPSFNDDIQGTGAVALAGLIGSGRVSGRELGDERIIVFGAGAGGLGIARQIRAGYAQRGFDDAQIRARIAVLDSRGLIVADNEIRDEYKRELAWSENRRAASDSATPRNVRLRTSWRSSSDRADRRVGSGGQLSGGVDQTGGRARRAPRDFSAVKPQRQL